MTPEEWEQGIQKWQQSGGMEGNKLPDPKADDPSTLATVGQGALDFGKGALKGAGSNVTGLVTGAHNLIGTPDLPQSIKDLTTTGPDAGYAEQAGHLVGDYGSLAIPGLDFGLGARFGAKAGEWAISHGPEFLTLAKKFGADRAQQIVEAMWSGRNAAEKGGSIAAKGAIGGVAHDPEHPGEGAAIGAATPIVASGARATLGKAWRSIPKEAKWLGGATAAGAGGAAMEHLAHDQRTGFGSWPAWYIGHNIPSALAALAALGLKSAPGTQGAIGADLFGSGDNSQ